MKNAKNREEEEEEISENLLFCHKYKYSCIKVSTSLSSFPNDSLLSSCHAARHVTTAIEEAHAW